MAGPLDGVRVLELTRVGPGAFCTMMLADMGADVLKIEPPPTGALRGSGASPGPDEARTLATSFTNRNKRSLTLNLKSPEGQEILHGLVRDHDVLVEGFRPGVMERLGGGYERLSGINPRLVLLRPERLRPGRTLSRTAPPTTSTSSPSPGSSTSSASRTATPRSPSTSSPTTREPPCTASPGSCSPSTRASGPGGASSWTSPTSTPPSPSSPRPRSCATGSPTAKCRGVEKGCSRGGTPTTAPTAPATARASPSAAPSRGCGTTSAMRWTARTSRNAG